MTRLVLIVSVLLLSLPTNALGKPGDIGQDWTLTTPEGLDVNLNDEVQQQATILFFWASWCPYCKALMPHLQSMRFEYGNKVKILAITIFEDGDPAAVIADAGYDFTLLPDGDVEAGEYGITSTPGVILLNKDRVVRFDLRTLPRIEPPATAKSNGHRPKAAYKAPYWAAHIRNSLDALIAEDYAPGTANSSAK